MSSSPSEIRAALLELALRRGPSKTFCPSEVARGLAPGDWRSLMPEVRRVANEMVATGDLRMTQKGARVDPETARGPIRLGLPTAD